MSPPPLSGVQHKQRAKTSAEEPAPAAGEAVSLLTDTHTREKLKLSLFSLSFFVSPLTGRRCDHPRTGTRAIGQTHRAIRRGVPDARDAICACCRFHDEAYVPSFTSMMRNSLLCLSLLRLTRCTSPQDLQLDHGGDQETSDGAEGERLPRAGPLRHRPRRRAQSHF